MDDSHRFTLQKPKTEVKRRTQPVGKGVWVSGIGEDLLRRERMLTKGHEEKGQPVFSTEPHVTVICSAGFCTVVVYHRLQ